MSGINKVIIVGNLGDDPKVNFMPSGDPVANLSIATSETWKDKQTGEQKSKTEWHRVVIFGKLAEIAGEYLKKGSKVYVEGKLQTRKWTNQQGQEQYTTEVVLQGFNGVMQMLDGKSSGQGGGQSSGSQGQQQGGFQGQQGQQQGGFAQQNQQGQGQQRAYQPPSQQLEQKRQQAQQQNAQQSGQQQGGYQQNSVNQGDNMQNQQPSQNQQQGQQQAPSIDFDDDIPFN